MAALARNAQPGGKTTPLDPMTTRSIPMQAAAQARIKDGDRCQVVGGTHAGKSGTVRDIHTSKTGAVTITVVQDSGVRFKTLAKNVTVERPGTAR